jgi:hypothetical protein
MDIAPMPILFPDAGKPVVGSSFRFQANDYHGPNDYGMQVTGTTMVNVYDALLVSGKGCRNEQVDANVALGSLTYCKAARATSKDLGDADKPVIIIYTDRWQVAYWDWGQGVQSTDPQALLQEVLDYLRYWE